MAAVKAASGGRGSLTNDDLLPVPAERRTWTWVNFTTVWMGMVHNIVAYTTAAGLIALGLSAGEALAAVVVANLFLVAGMWLNGAVGTKYGVPFPVIMRACFGHRGAQLPVVVRAAVAMFWFAVQTYAGSLAINAIFGLLIPGWGSLTTSILGMPLNVAASFVAYWALHAWVISHGMSRVKHFELWAGPLVILLALGLIVWAISRAHGLGPLFAQPGKLHGGAFWAVFFTSVAGMIGTWSTLVLNIPDFTRFGASQRDQVIGQGIGLPLTAIIFAFMSILITSGTVIAFGHPIADPVALLTRFHNPVVLVLGGGALVVATLSVNIAANVVSPAYDLVNLFPKKLNFVRAGILSTILAAGFAPWMWFRHAVVIFGILNVIGGTLGPVAGVMLTDYYIVHRRQYDTDALYSTNGAYSYTNGWNLRGLAALGVGLVASLIGNIVPPLKPLANYAWFIGLGTAAIIHVALSYKPLGAPSTVTPSSTSDPTAWNPALGQEASQA